MTTFSELPLSSALQPNLAASIRHPNSHPDAGPFPALEELSRYRYQAQLQLDHRGTTEVEPAFAVRSNGNSEFISIMSLGIRVAPHWPDWNDKLESL